MDSLEVQHSFPVGRACDRVLPSSAQIALVVLVRVWVVSLCWGLISLGPSLSRRFLDWSRRQPFLTARQVFVAAASVVRSTAFSATSTFTCESCKVRGGIRVCHAVLGGNASLYVCLHISNLDCRLGRPVSCSLQRRNSLSYNTNGIARLATKRQTINCSHKLMYVLLRLGSTNKLCLCWKLKQVNLLHRIDLKSW